MRAFYPGIMLMASLSSRFRLGLMMILASGCFILTLIPEVQHKAFIIFLIISALLYISLSLVHLTHQRLTIVTKHIHEITQLSAITLTSNDSDFNLLSNQINQLIRHIERKSILIENCASEAKYTATELANASSQLAKGAEQEHQTLNAITNTAEKMSSSVKQIAKHIDETESLAQHTQHVSEQGINTVNTLKHSLQQLDAEIKVNQINIKKLDDDTQNIKDFIGNITLINDQINLLALNAAIESARAGEAGRGFSVVANEIRLLATKTQQVNVDIIKLISQTQAQVQISNNTSQQITQLNFTSKAAANKAQNQLEKIQAAATTTHTAVNSAKSFVTDFTQGNERQYDRLQDIASLSEKNSLSSRDTKEMVTYLTRLSQKLESHKE